MNDIEILEKLQNIFKELRKDDEEGHSSAYELQLEDIEAIENLIQRNKDLEQIEKEHKEENGRLRDKIKELEKQYKILEVEKLRYNIQYLESDISQTPDTAMVYYSMKNCLETLREEKIKLETELQELLEESEK